MGSQVVVMFSVAYAELPKATVCFVMSACPSVRVAVVCPQRTTWLSRADFGDAIFEHSTC